jgi:hypothetical protein
VKYAKRGIRIVLPANRKQDWNTALKLLEKASPDEVGTCRWLVKRERQAFMKNSSIPSRIAHVMRRVSDSATQSESTSDWQALSATTQPTDSEPESNRVAAGRGDGSERRDNSDPLGMEGIEQAREPSDCDESEALFPKADVLIMGGNSGGPQLTQAAWERDYLR